MYKYVSFSLILLLGPGYRSNSTELARWSEVSSLRKHTTSFPICLPFHALTMNHILNIESQKDALHALFKEIQEQNTILFLGAGASVTEKRYLSSDIIQYYEQYLNKNLQENNITKWLDILSAAPFFNRNHFDGEVVKMLQKLKVTDAHKILASIPWREIITTNYDLLVEQAYDALAGTSRGEYSLKQTSFHGE